MTAITCGAASREIDPWAVQRHRRLRRPLQRIRQRARRVLHGRVPRDRVRARQPGGHETANDRRLPFIVEQTLNDHRPIERELSCDLEVALHEQYALPDAL